MRSWYTVRVTVRVNQLYGRTRNTVNSPTFHTIPLRFDFAISSPVVRQTISGDPHGHLMTSSWPQDIISRWDIQKGPLPPNYISIATQMPPGTATDTDETAPCGQPDISYIPDRQKWFNRTAKRLADHPTLLSTPLLEGFPRKLDSPLVWEGKDWKGESQAVAGVLVCWNRVRLAVEIGVVRLKQPVGVTVTSKVINGEEGEGSKRLTRNVRSGGSPTEGNGLRNRKNPKSGDTCTMG